MIIFIISLTFYWIQDFHDKEIFGMKKSLANQIKNETNSNCL